MVDSDQAQPVSVDSYSAFTPYATVGITVEGVRRTRVKYWTGGTEHELTCDGIPGDPPEVDMDKNSDIPKRLHDVELTVVRIDERLKHMPTTAQLWKGLAYAAGTVLVTLLGGGWWAIQQYLAPILSSLNK